MPIRSGRRLRRLRWEGDNAWLSVVGVVADTKRHAYDDDSAPVLYVPYTQDTYGNRGLVIRTRAEPLALAAAVRETIWKINSDQSVFDIRTMNERLGASVAQQRFAMFLLACLAAVALALAMIGVYGVLSYSVGRRTSEIGLRMAIGATPRDVLRLVVGQGMSQVLGGLAIGMIGALMAARLIAGMLFETSPSDPVTLVLGALLLAVAGFLATYLPARRATRIDPLEALRTL